MNLSKIVLIASLVCFSAILTVAQTKTKPPVNVPVTANQAKSSPAYAEVLLRKTELLAELESLLVEYTEDYPNVKQMRYQTGLLQKELNKISAFNQSESAKLSIALGKLIVRKCELDTDLWSLQQEFNDQHPDVKRAKRKSEIFDAAIKEILQGK